MTIAKKLLSLSLLLVFTWPLWLNCARADDKGMNINCDRKNMCASSIQVGARVRTFHYYMHGGVTTAFNPLYRVIYVFHAENTDGLTFDMKIMDGSMDSAEAKVPFMVVYPDAVNGLWNFGPDSTVTDVDDVAFISNLMAFFEDTHNQAKLKNYAAGMGNGGLMVFRLGCEISSKLNALAVVDASMPVSLLKNCKPTNKISLLLFEGHEDKFTPINKHYMAEINMPIITTLTPSQTFDFWSTLVDLNIPSVFLLVPLKAYDGTYAYKELRRNSKSEVRMYTIFGGGHTWPGGAQYLPLSMVGKTSSNFSASATMIDFFWGH
jgi:polyhydroxybutyrate depolymerase